MSEGELSVTEAVYYNTISLNFLEGVGRIRRQSDYPSPYPSFVEKGMDLKRLTRTVHVMEVKDGFCFTSHCK